MACDFHLAPSDLDNDIHVPMVGDMCPLHAVGILYIRDLHGVQGPHKWNAMNLVISPASNADALQQRHSQYCCSVSRSDLLAR